MAVVKGEMRQIVKLSTWEKLNTERRKYRDLVRYKVPFAARIPATSYAIESRGVRGFMDAESKVASMPVEYSPGDPAADTFGALVSDLVDGTGDTSDSPRSIAFLYLAAEQILKRHGVDQLEASKELIPALSNHFLISTALWRNLNDDQKEAWETSLRLASSTGDSARASASDVLKAAFRLQEFKIHAGSTTRIARSIGQLERSECDKVVQILEYLNRWILKDVGASLAKRLEIDTSYLESVVGAISKLLDDPVALFTVGTTDFLDEVPAIVHGDLNARNLAWAGAFERFFLIDFEHVAYGFAGIDQFRLILSLTADLWGAVVTTIGENRLEHREEDLCSKAGEDLEDAIILIDRITDVIDKSGFDLGASIQHLKDKGISLDKHFLCHAIVTILSTLGENSKKRKNRISFSRRTNIAKDWWKFLAFCASAKEFEYSLRDLDGRLVNALHGALTVTNVQSGSKGPAALLMALQKSDSPVDQKIAGARFILSFCCLLASLPRPRSIAP
jgi:hypothetical protein